MDQQDDLSEFVRLTPNERFDLFTDILAREIVKLSLQESGKNVANRPTDNTHFDKGRGEH